MPATLPEDIYSRLTSFAGLSSLVSNRVTPLRFKQNTALPAIRYTRISSDRPSCMGVDAGVLTEFYQFDIVGATHISVKTVERQLILALQRWRVPDEIMDTFISSTRDDFDDETQQYVSSVDVEFITYE